jgi:hypothetical protein
MKKKRKEEIKFASFPPLPSLPFHPFQQTLVTRSEVPILTFQRSKTLTLPIMHFLLFLSFFLSLFKFTSYHFLAFIPRQVYP